MIKIDLKKLAKSKGFTLTDISKATGISMNTLSVLGRNVSTGIQFDTLDKICRFLACTPNDVIKIVSDSYIVHVDAQNIKEKTIRAAATKKSIFDNAQKNNIMYNMDKEDTIFYITFLAFANNKALFSIDYSAYSAVNKNVKEQESKSQKWLSSLDKESKISICKQGIGIYLQYYWNGNIPKNISVSINDGNGGNVYSFVATENDSKVTLTAHQ
ncbi:helix-turn-helix domain-containing protein [Lactiplantibacillus plantarum]|uniref:helix-turn-helix domain-containing protein n=1 Tax=Lactiplantibacillus plantarum TaxID=1590 RepID=UPI001BAD6DA1|nr:helix-turn-helix domain-containing protein [Lactiplantibacillus plantarum]MBS0954702.1 helix-turn-helix domain-containing protein [Lactiplantibacillus plantarum]